MKQKLVKFNVNFYQDGAVLYAEGKCYPLTEDTERRVVLGDAEFITVNMAAEKAQELADKAKAAALRAQEAAQQAQDLADAAVVAEQAAKDAAEAMANEDEQHTEAEPEAAAEAEPEAAAEAEPEATAEAEPEAQQTLIAP